MAFFFCRMAATLACLWAALGVTAAFAQAQTEFLFRYGTTFSEIGPRGMLARAPDGTLFAANYGVGQFSRGSVFSFSPPASPGGPWTLGLVHSFNEDAGGKLPKGGVTRGPDGALYGTTSQGGANDAGLVFKMTPPAIAGDPWTKQILYEFGSGGGGYHPTTELLLESDGKLYGTTEFGGPTSCGIAFSLTPKPGGGTPWTFRKLITFPMAFGCIPRTKLTRGPDGALYGALFAGGGNNGGTVYKLIPQATGPYTLVRLRAFAGSSGPANPIGGIAFDSSGRLFGALRNGGAYNCGAVYRLTAPTGGQTLWNLSYVKMLPGGPGSGCFPIGVAFQDGKLAVATYEGGGSNVGALLSYSPATSGPAPYAQRLLSSFESSSRYPQGTPLFGPSGELYGANGISAAIWRVTP